MPAQDNFHLWTVKHFARKKEYAQLTSSSTYRNIIIHHTGRGEIYREKSHHVTSKKRTESRKGFVCNSFPTSSCILFPPLKKCATFIFTCLLIPHSFQKKKRHLDG